MKTTDLMIGDWVMLINDQTGKPYKKAMITHIDSIRERIAAKTEINTFAAWSTKYIKPIPLTSEILDKNDSLDISWDVLEWTNGFVYCEIDDEKRDDEDDEYGGFTIKGCFRYVHQLQHALKLCGIKEKIVL
jgi:hypothetical protein